MQCLSLRISKDSERKRESKIKKHNRHSSCSYTTIAGGSLLNLKCHHQRLPKKRHSKKGTALPLSRKGQAFKVLKFARHGKKSSV